MPTMLGLTTDSRPTTGSPASGQSGNDTSKRPTGRLNTIEQRNLAAAHDSERLFWRAITDQPEAVLDVVADDCVMINPIFFGFKNPATGKPNIENALKRSTHWSSYRIHSDSFRVVEIGLMDIATVYRITLSRYDKNGQEQVEALGSSVWRQTAGADWVLCSQLVGYAD